MLKKTILLFTVLTATFIFSCDLKQNFIPNVSSDSISNFDSNIILETENSETETSLTQDKDTLDKNNSEQLEIINHSLKSSPDLSPDTESLNKKAELNYKNNISLDNELVNKFLYIFDNNKDFGKDKYSLESISSHNGNLLTKYNINSLKINDRTNIYIEPIYSGQGIRIFREDSFGYEKSAALVTVNKSNVLEPVILNKIDKNNLILVVWKVSEDTSNTFYGKFYDFDLNEKSKTFTVEN